MKFINKYKSKNFNKRKTKQIIFIIIHYTALKRCNDAIEYLCNSKNKVSSHYLISQNGKIFNLVNEKMRAWHAGLSYWNDHIDINSSSIGMELDYTENVKDARGASYILNVLRNCINEAGWVTSTVLKVRGSDAPNEGTASKESDTDSKVYEEEERASKSSSAAV